MSIWSLADLHLSLSNPDKDMSFFGPSWENYANKIKESWKRQVSEEDLVLLPGDISWASSLELAKTDLEWIAELPGTKVMIKGNHDYWWGSNAKMEKALPPSVHFIHNNAFTWKEVTIGGARLWDTSEYNFDSFIEYVENPRETKKAPVSKEEIDKQFQKELGRLRLSLNAMDKNAKVRIAMTHYPPIGADLAPSLASKILEEYGVSICTFGHLHSVKKDSLPFGEARGVKYVFTAADYVDFALTKILP